MSDDSAARRALFTDVTPARPRKKPRWLSPRESTLPPPVGPAPTHAPPASLGTHPPHETAPSLRPAPVPKEFVQAVKRELIAGPATQHERAREILAHEVLREQMARSLRPSEAPSATSHEPPRPVVDPALERAFRGAIEEMAVARARILEDAAGQLAALAAVIARRVIARELALAPDILADLVREALEALSEQDRVRIRVGRGFQTAVDGLEQELSARGGKFTVVIESNLGDYDCLVETELGRVDESVERRLEKLLEALKPDSEAP